MDLVPSTTARKIEEIPICARSPERHNLLVQPRELLAYDYSLGHTVGEGPIKVVVFSDFQCPHCRKLFRALYPLAQQNPRRVLLNYRAFPLPSHPRAWATATAAEAAGRQGHYWDYAELLYQDEAQLDETRLRTYASQLGLDLARFERDRRARPIEEDLQIEREDARARKILGVPACFINQKQRPADASAASLVVDLLAR